MFVTHSRHMIRKAFVMKLHPGQEQEYENRHNPIWRELSEVLARQGVRDYSIFLDQGSGRLFGYAVIEDEDRWDDIANDPVCRKWWDHMADIMDTNDDNSPKAVPLREVFHWTPKG